MENNYGVEPAYQLYFLECNPLKMEDFDRQIK